MAMSIPMCHADRRWPSFYEKIAAELHTDLTVANINFVSINHFGSTSIPKLNAKPVIDIMITLPSEDFENPQTFPRVRDALRDGDQQGGYYYIGNGGVLERWSFKLGIREDMEGRPLKPYRNVYVVADGCLQHRNAVDFRDCLRKEENADLREEYGKMKWDLARREDVTVFNYGDLKNEVIRKVLLRAGWSREDILAKECLKVRNWPEHLIMGGESEPEEAASGPKEPNYDLDEHDYDEKEAYSDGVEGESEWMEAEGVLNPGKCGLKVW